MQLDMFAELYLADPAVRAVGAHGENLAARLLRAAGYHVEQARRGNGDLRVETPDGEIIRVEVKTARRTRKGWKWCLRKADRYGHTDISDADVVLFLAILKTGCAVPFVVPVEALGALKTFCIRSHPQDYRGRFAKYRQKGTLSLEVANNEKEQID